VTSRVILFWIFAEYLGRVLCKDDSDDMAAYTSLKKDTLYVWGQFKSLLQAGGASVVETMGRSIENLFYRHCCLLTLGLWFGATPLEFGKRRASCRLLLSTTTRNKYNKEQTKYN
jgi:hypothetical protein